MVLAKILLSTKPGLGVVGEGGGRQDFKGLRLRRGKDLVTSEKLLRWKTARIMGRQSNKKWKREWNYFF